MIRFHERFRLHVLHWELATVLHHASTWSNVSRSDIVVIAGCNDPCEAGTLHAWDLAIDIEPELDKMLGAEQLGAYLGRILPPGYDVLIKPTFVHVEWDQRRRVPGVVPDFHDGEGEQERQSSRD